MRTERETAPIEYKLYHGTTTEAAQSILSQNKFKYSDAGDNWCGKGIYFFDIKDKAWYAANRKCEELNSNDGKRYDKDVIEVNVSLKKNEIFDLRVYRQMQEFQKFVKEIGLFVTEEIPKDFDLIVETRAHLIAFYAEEKFKKLVIGYFKTQVRKDRKITTIFAEAMGMIFNIDAIYCVKDMNCITRILKEGGKLNDNFV